jgi:hypothetical protein
LCHGRAQRRHAYSQEPSSFYGPNPFLHGTQKFVADKDRLYALSADEEAAHLEQELARLPRTLTLRFDSTQGEIKANQHYSRTKDIGMCASVRLHVLAPIASLSQGPMTVDVTDGDNSKCPLGILGLVAVRQTLFKLEGANRVKVISHVAMFNRSLLGLQVCGRAVLICCHVARMDTTSRSCSRLHTAISCMPVTLASLTH